MLPSDNNNSDKHAQNKFMTDFNNEAKDLHECVSEHDPSYTLQDALHMHSLTHLEMLAVHLETLQKHGYLKDAKLTSPDLMGPSQDKQIEVAETLFKAHSEHDPDYTLKDALKHVGII